MGDPSNPRAQAMARIEAEAASWAGVTVAPHRFGGVEFVLGRGEIGHLHGNGLLDVPFPRSVRDDLVASGRAEPHHVLPDSGWVSFFVRSDADATEAIELLRLSYDRRTARRPPVDPEARLDEALEESFPASDAPAVEPG